MFNKVIAIDYDDVISLNIKAWKQIINIFTSFGATVYIVTYRNSTDFEDMDLTIPNVKDIIFTNATAKRKYCKSIGIYVNIWIDDMPDSIIFDYKELMENMEIK